MIAKENEFSVFDGSIVLLFNCNVQVALLWQRDRATRLSVEILQLTKHPI